MTRGLRIAMLGSRGVPATFGGIEHHVEAIGRRLVERGHDVTVFCEADYISDSAGVANSYLGMKLVRVPTVRSKHLEALVHSARSTFSAVRGGYDIIHYHAVGPGVFSAAPRFLSRSKVVQTIHGLDAERAKWNFGARWMLLSATWLSARVPDSTVVVSEALERHYAVRYRRSTTHIPNGVDLIPNQNPGPALARLGLTQGRYLLFVGRLVPEKCPDLLMRAFARVVGDWKLVIVGGASYSDDYVAQLRHLASFDPRVLMPGYIYGAERDELYSNAGAFVLPSALEGLPLTLLEAIAAGVPVVASDIEPHVEVLAASRAGGRLFAHGNEDGLVDLLQRSVDDPTTERRGVERLRNDILHRYDWDSVTDQLEAEYARIRPHTSYPVQNVQ